jgi:hypothetical protein
VQLEWWENSLAAASFPAIVPVQHPLDGMRPDGNRLEMISGIPYSTLQTLTESLDDGVIRSAPETPGNEATGREDHDPMAARKARRGACLQPLGRAS